MGKTTVAITKSSDDGYIKVVKNFEVVMRDLDSGSLYQRSFAVPQYDGYSIQAIELLLVESTYSCQIYGPGDIVFGLNMPDIGSRYLWANFAFREHSGKNSFRFTSHLIYAKKKKEYSIIKSSCMYSLYNMNLVGTGIQY